GRGQPVQIARRRRVTEQRARRAEYGRTWAHSSRAKALLCPSRCSANPEGQRGVEIEMDETERIDREAAVRGEPVEVRARHAPRRADVAEQLIAGDAVSHRAAGSTAMEVLGDYA